MNKHMIVGITMAMGILTVGVASASAADACGKCADQQSVQQFTQETASLSRTLKAKDSELRGLYVSDSIDSREVSALEEEIQELKAQINAAAQKFNIPACSRG